ncbi:MAG: hypothetical protein A2562_02300 [Candidatus Nealsonbacteria bacterium RIFOXYD1_FULL_39_11]|nr:MAG: hypothetical protein A2562_02300 [Candidatus Nealsonbacteria bacterium RIFOXYD1_FULL_39_11]
MNKFIIPLVVILAALIIGGALAYNSYSKCTVSSGGANIISSADAGNKLIDFVNNNILRGQATASLIDTFEENGVYKVKFDVSGQQAEWRITKDGSFIFPQTIDLAEVEDPADNPGTTVGNFSVSSEEICYEDGKPVVYFFGSESCPHCVWEKPVIRGVASKFEGLIAYHENIDNDADQDIFKKYSTGGIPTLVIGCKYYRVGSGEQSGEETEGKNLAALMCKLTQNQPEEACEGLEDLVNSIN